MAHGIDLPGWIDAQLADAPTELAARTREFIDRAGGPLDPETLAAAAQLALDRAIQGALDRPAALDLLAADALVTLALAASVERDPAGLEAFALAIRRSQESAS